MPARAAARATKKAERGADADVRVDDVVVPLADGPDPGQHAAGMQHVRAAEPLR